jgi:hypothetical protein
MVLSFRQHGHRSQCHGRKSLAGCFNPHSTEEDVPDEALLPLGNQGGEHDTFVAQAINQIRLVGPAESRFVDQADSGTFSGVFTTDDHAVVYTHI